MEKNKFRAMIKHLHMKGLTPKEIKVELNNVHSTSAPTFVTLGMKKLSARWCFEEGEDHEVDRKGDGHSFLGCTRYNSYRLPSVEAKRSMVIGEEESTVPSRQCMGSHVPSMAKFNEFHYELLPHPAYSPDLAPCDYFLFPNLKKWFRGKRVSTKEQLIAETKVYFKGLDKSYYSDSLKKLKNRWVKCIELKGDYVEK
ncbi:SETMR methyltransferase, partial [Acromyrmex heyeri]